MIRGDCESFFAASKERGKICRGEKYILYWPSGKCNKNKRLHTFVRSLSAFHRETAPFAHFYSALFLGFAKLGNGPKTVSESTVSNTELWVFWPSVLGRELSEPVIRVPKRNSWSPSSSKNSPSLWQNSVSSLFQNSTLETVFCPFPWKPTLLRTWLFWLVRLCGSVPRRPPSGRGSFCMHMCQMLCQATIIHSNCGWFFIMPNPKYHTEVDSRIVQFSSSC